MQRFWIRYLESRGQLLDLCELFLSAGFHVCCDGEQNQTSNRSSVCSIWQRFRSWHWPSTSILTKTTSFSRERCTGRSVKYTTCERLQWVTPGYLSFSCHQFASSRVASCILLTLSFRLDPEWVEGTKPTQVEDKKGHHCANCDTWQTLQESIPVNPCKPLSSRQTLSIY